MSEVRAIDGTLNFPKYYGHTTHISVDHVCICGYMGEKKKKPLATASSRSKKPTHIQGKGNFT